MTARLIGIARRARSRAPMAELSQARVGLAGGVEGDLRGTKPGRQVVVLSREGWEAACRALGLSLPWTLRRANLLVEGVDLEATTGARLQIGPVRLAITGECDPCRVMDEQHPGLRRALAPAWRAGVTCSVVEAGAIRIGDAVVLQRSEV